MATAIQDLLPERPHLHHMPIARRGLVTVLVLLLTQKIGSMRTKKWFRCKAAPLQRAMISAL